MYFRLSTSFKARPGTVTLSIRKAYRLVISYSSGTKRVRECLRKTQLRAIAYSDVGLEHFFLACCLAASFFCLFRSFHLFSRKPGAFGEKFQIILLPGTSRIAATILLSPM